MPLPPTATEAEVVAFEQHGEGGPTESDIRFYWDRPIKEGQYNAEALTLIATVIQAKLVAVHHSFDDSFLTLEHIEKRLTKTLRRTYLYVTRVKEMVAMSVEARLTSGRELARKRVDQLATDRATIRKHTVSTGPLLASLY